MHWASIRSIHDERTHRVFRQFLPAAQKAEFDKKGDLQDLRAKPADKGGGGSGGATGGQQVVNQQHAAAGLEGIHVDSDGGRTIFQSVLLLVRLIGEFALFANGDESRLKLHRGGGSED